MINYVGGHAVPIQLREERDFSLDVDELAALINDRTKLDHIEFAAESYGRRARAQRHRAASRGPSATAT